MPHSFLSIHHALAASRKRSSLVRRNTTPTSTEAPAHLSRSSEFTQAFHSPLRRADEKEGRKDDAWITAWITEGMHVVQYAQYGAGSTCIVYNEKYSWVPETSLNDRDVTRPVLFWCLSESLRIAIHGCTVLLCMIGLCGFFTHDGTWTHSHSVAIVGTTPMNVFGPLLESL